MEDFQYLRPKTLKDALALLDRFGTGARAMIGGTDLMVRILKGHAVPDGVIDLKQVQDISNTIDADDGMLNIGALVVLSDLVQNQLIRKHVPALVDAASIVGSVQIRNRATLTGNICNGSPAADTVPVLMVHGASVTVAGTGGTRTVPLSGFFLGPGKTVCAPSELVVSVHLPIPEEPFGAAFGRVTRRKGVDLATVNMACSINGEGITTFVFGAAGPAPVTARDESGTLAGKELSDTRRDGILASLISKTSPISDVRAGKEYRRAMLLTISSRVLKQARQRYTRQAG